MDCTAPSTTSSPTRWRVLGELGLLFLRLGATAFGGPAAHIGMFEHEFVRRRKWLSREQFLDLLGLVNLIPGPNSTEIAIHIGYLRGGWLGLIVAGVAFILPAMTMVTAIAWAYVQFGALPQFDGALAGVKPVVLAVIAQALWGLGRTAIKSWSLAVVVAATLTACHFKIDGLLLLLAAGAIVGLLHGWKDRAQHAGALVVMLLVAGGLLGLVQLLSVATAHGPAVFGQWPLFWYFLKIGGLMYGTGYVLLALLQGDLVQRWGWLTAQQLLDATAVGQVTPGPLFTTATFIGFVKGSEAGGLTGGLLGAVLATVGIFLPAFVFVAFSGPLIARLRSSVVAGAFLDGVNAAALALMAAVTLQLAGAAIVDWTTAALALASAVLLLRYRINSAWLVLGGAAAGVAASLFRGG